ncbi:response regulator [Burkholderia sp. Bp9017]|uniref:response regulator n=1 Tax=Burkholderia TaxID=32008 RepID=UPI000F5E834E|nr:MULTISPECIES: response regulator [Burkholderia]RQZ27632.1 response regulator [Burkholderia sp. Bp9017]RQZ35462.1 response regulator [Burkholderia sp. Bp9016]
MSEPSVVVVIVDDDRLIRHFVRVALKAEHMNVCEAATGVAGVAAVRARHPDLIVADTNLRDIGGTALIRAVRACSAAPLIVLSALSAERDKVAALDAGADDYLTKPFGTAELIARIRAHLRRQAGGGCVGPVRVCFGDVIVDLGNRQVLRGGARVHLSPIEYRLLAVLAHHAGRLLTHDRLLNEVWVATHDKDAHYLRVYVGHLRRKLEYDPRRPQHIVTETGVGYRLAGAQ